MPKSLDVPLVPDMIHRPDAPRHMMRARKLDRPVRIERDGQVLAETTRAVQVQEIGRDVYDPVYYLPMDDVSVELRATDKSTHCPLKGDTTYYDLADGSGEAIAWAYTKPLPFSEELRDLVAFDAAQVTTVLPATG